MEQWGLINYQVDNDAKAAPLGPPCTSHFTILADTPSGLAPITSSRPTTGAVAGKQIAEISSISNKKRDENEQKGNSLENAGLKNDQYIKKGNKSGMRTREWSDQEILLLLEGLEIYKDDWNKVCEHVGTRTQDECILKFLQLPIEDPYLDGTNNSALGPLSYQPIPFSQSGNPIMSTVAFLASVVDPRIASAAAKAAISEFSKMKDEVPPQLMDSHLANVSQLVKEGKKIDSNYNIEQTGIAIINAETTNNSSSSTLSVLVEQTSSDKDSSVTKMEFESSSQTNDKLITENNSSTSLENPTNQTNGDSADNMVKIESSVSTTSTTTVTITSTSQTNLKDNNINENEIKSAAASALAAAAVKAKHLSIIEEKKIKSAVAQLVETQLKKLEIKLRHFEELEALMDRERETLEYQRQQLLQERQQFYLEQLKAAEIRQKDLAFQQLKIEGKIPAPSTQTIILKQSSAAQISNEANNMINNTGSMNTSTTTLQQPQIIASSCTPTNVIQNSSDASNEQGGIISANVNINQNSQATPQSQTVIVMSMPQVQLQGQQIMQQIPLQQYQPILQHQQQLQQTQPSAAISNSLETGRILIYFTFENLFVFKIF